MNQRKLGTHGYTIGEVGLGCWQFGGDFGPLTEAEAFAILAAAVDSGVDFFDTADVYGDGRSERLIGRFLTEHHLHDSITIATKFGRSGDVFPDNYSRQALIDGVKGSCDRLQVDTLDLVQLHCIPQQVLEQGDVFDWLRELQDNDLIRHFGASVESVEEGLLCLRQDGLLSLQVIYNIFRQKLTEELLPQARAKGVGIIVRLPLASGLLAGKFSRDTSFPESDHRHYNRDGQCFNVGETFAGLPFETGVELADELKPHVPAGMTMAQMAQRWILDHEEVSVIIPGASSPQQARANAATSNLPALPQHLHREFRALYQDSVHDAIRGPY